MKVQGMKNNYRKNFSFIDLIPDKFNNKINFIVSTRHGGISKAPYDQLNLSFNVGDEQGAVEYNRKVFFDKAGCNGAHVYKPEQIHGDNIVEIKNNDPYLIKAADALITKEKNAVLSVMTADCMPILIFDPVNKAFGIIHAGWKGAFLFLPGKTLRKMTKAFKTRPYDCLAVLGPAICSDCYEVNNDLVEKNTETFRFGELGIIRNNSKIYLDLVEINSEILLAAGLKKGNIHKTGLCTSCLPEFFYSHRRDGGKTGRMMSLAWME